MADFRKYEWEELYRYYEFKRRDGEDGLQAGVTLSTCTVTCEDEVGADTSTTMISGAAIIDGFDTLTRVKYMLKAGTKGKAYKVYIKAVTSDGQKLKGLVTVRII